MSRRSLPPAVALRLVRSVSIQGISGSGKTTLGRALAARLGVPHLETDALVHGPDWTETPDAELRAAHRAHSCAPTAG